MPRRVSNAPCIPVVATIDIGTTSARAILGRRREIAKIMNIPPLLQRPQKTRQIQINSEEDLLY